MNEKLVDTKKWYKDKFSEFQNKLNGGKDSLLNHNRLRAFEKFEQIPFPTRKDEEWKYTNVSSLLKENFIPANNLDLSSAPIKTEDYLLPGLDTDYLVFINGIFQKDYSNISSLPDGVFVGNLHEAIKQKPDEVAQYLGRVNSNEDTFSMLNGSFADDGFVLIMPKNKKLQKPVQVLFISGDKNENISVHLHNLIVMGENSEANVIFHYMGGKSNKYFSNPVNELVIEKNAVLDLIKIQDEQNDSYHIDRTSIRQKSDSVLNHFSFDFGSKLTRNDVSCLLSEEHIECNLSGLYIVNENRHIDNHTFVDHAVPNCISNELYKGILDDHATGVFSGKIMVRKDAQKTQAYQSNKNVLLSESANVDTKPQLEIFADDVKCSHGATVGSLDKNGEYYLRTRGIPKNLAQSILIHAFAVDVLDSLKIEALKELLNKHVFEQLHRKYI